MNHNLLFVYGTLRRGLDRHRMLRRLRADWFGNGTVVGELYDLGSFPGAKETNHPGKRVTGEVYRLVDPLRDLQVLDRYEGVHIGVRAEGLYSRKRVQVMLEGGGQVEAWIYWLQRKAPVMRPIPSGDYARR